MTQIKLRSSSAFHKLDVDLLHITAQACLALWLKGRLSTALLGCMQEAYHLLGFELKDELVLHLAMSFSS